MKLVPIKNAKDLLLAGVAVSFEQHENSLTRITLTDDVGNFVVIQKGEYYGNGVVALKKAPLEMVERFTVKGRFLGVVDVCDVFETERDAEAALDQYSAKSGHQSAEAIGLKIERVRVEVDDDGNAAKIVGAAPVEPLPF